MNTSPPHDFSTLLASLNKLQQQVVAIRYPNPSDLIGRELSVIDRSLKRLLRELGERDSVEYSAAQPHEPGA